MKIGLVDVDGHNFPNLALMRISAYHKAQGDAVEWWLGDLFYYDIVYKSKVFSDAYSPDKPDPVNCGQLLRGGAGIASAEARTAKSASTPHSMRRSRPKSSGCSPTIRFIRSTTSQSA